MIEFTKLFIYALHFLMEFKENLKIETKSTFCKKILIKDEILALLSKLYLMHIIGLMNV